MKFKKKIFYHREFFGGVFYLHGARSGYKNFEIAWKGQSTVIFSKRRKISTIWTDPCVIRSSLRFVSERTESASAKHVRGPKRSGTQGVGPRRRRHAPTPKQSKTRRPGWFFRLFFTQSLNLYKEKLWDLLMPRDTLPPSPSIILSPWAQMEERWTSVGGGVVVSLGCVAESSKIFFYCYQLIGF